MPPSLQEALRTSSSSLLQSCEQRILSWSQTPQGGTLTLFVGDLSLEDRKTLDKTLKNFLSQIFPDTTWRVSYASRAKEPAPSPKTPPSPPHSSVPTPTPIPGVKTIVAVASGKGGVGKSAFAALLACACARLGLKTALLDADIYGPSQAQIFGVTTLPEIPPEANQLSPIDADGIALMSFSFFISGHEPVIWRGPLIMKVLQQFFFDVAWGDRDILIIDLPPGTGDAQLSMVQCVPVSGAVMVTTPQHVAVIDVLKGAAMFQKVGVPLLGVVENMSHFECPRCHSHHALFRTGGGDVVASQMETKLLGRLPLLPKLCTLLDTGRVQEALLIPSIHQEMLTIAHTLIQACNLPLPSLMDPCLRRDKAQKKRWSINPFSFLSRSS